MGGRVRTLDGVDPTTTVLSWLREHERRTGTKEGCAEGDCGACTVVVGELAGARVRYRPVNACILFVGALDGKVLLTVEDLAGPDGALDPAQAAMVDLHGSQCGFCTPGIVMSLFALRHEPGPADRVADALAGNLCRCTGYRPIVAAARRLLADGRASDAEATREAVTVAQLRGLRRRATLHIDGPGCRWIAPTTPDELAKVARRHPRAVVLAGGTDAGRWVTKDHRDLDTVIHTGGVTALRRVVARPSHVEIGAAASLADVAGPLRALQPELGELLDRFGSPQIRSLATLGGNLATASPVGDLAPALIALGATVVLRHGRRTRELPVERFLRGRRRTARAPGEIVERVRVRRAPPDATFRAYKVTKRFEQDIATVSAAFLIEIDGDAVRAARLAFGGMAPAPARARHAERALVGRPWNAASVAEAQAALARDFTPIDDARASAAYRMRVAGNLLERCLLESTEDTIATRVAVP
jgi:xanthine dehydrogenase small subunit